jgi:hypothetical protein
MIVDVSVSVSALVVVAAGVNGNAPVEVIVPVILSVSGPARGLFALLIAAIVRPRVSGAQRPGRIRATGAFPFTPAATLTVQSTIRSTSTIMIT